MNQVIKGFFFLMMEKGIEFMFFIWGEISKWETACRFLMNMC